jgi:CBS domain-containing protein
MPSSRAILREKADTICYFCDSGEAMMREKRIGDVTFPLGECPHMPYWGTLKEAIVLLNVAHETGHNIVLVFDEAYKLVGILSQTAILKGLDTSHGIKKRGPLFSWDTLLGEKTEEQLSRSVKDFMAKAKVTVDVSESILKATQIMLQEDSLLLPVIEEDRVVGVVRIGDLFHHISNAILKL